MKKLLLGLALSGLAVAGTIGLTKVNAEENFSYTQDFIYIGGTYNAATYDVHTTVAEDKGSITSINEENGILRISQAEDASAVLGVDFRSKQPNQTNFYNKENTDAVFKLKFRTNSIDNTNLRLYFPGANIGLSTGSLTLNLLGLRDGKIIYHDGTGEKTITGSPYDSGLERDVWYELTAVFDENGDNTDPTNPDMYYVYLNGEYLYSAQIKTGANFIGQIYDVSLQLGVDSDVEVETLDLDYMSFGDYNGGVATAPEDTIVTVNDNFELSPIVTANNQDYDLSINDDWTPSFSQEDVLTYDAETSKFTAVGPGTVDVTFNFNDPMIQSVTTSVTVEAGDEEVLVEAIELQGFADNTINLVVGESYDLDNLFKATNPAATNKEFAYQTGGNNYNVTGSIITATQVGESELTVNATDGGDATLTVKVNVVEGTYINAPAVGTEFASAGDTALAGDINYQTGQYSGHSYSKVSVVDDSLYGPTFAFEGSGGAASNVLAWIDGSKLEANKNYVLTVYAKLSGSISASSRVDLKIDGYRLVENEEGNLGYSYNSIFHKEIRTEASKFVADEWLKIEAPLINFDTTRLDGLKIELVSWNTANGMTTYISHPSLVVTDEAATLDGVEATVNDVVLVNTEADAKSITLTSVGANAQVNVLPVPSIADLGEVTYESSNGEVATISNTGLITAVNDGETTIKVTTTKGTYYVIVNVVIERPIESIDVENKNVTLTIDDKTFNIPLIINPSDYTSNLIISAADPTIVSVDNDSVVNGKLYIVPLKAGSTTITITVEGNDSISLTLNVTVTAGTEEPEEPTDKPCTGITLDKVSVTLNVGDTHSIKVTLNPTDTTDEVTYTSSNTSIVTVDKNGKVTAVAEGTATVTVKCGDITANLNVTVNVVETPSEEPENGSNAGLIWGIVGGVIGVAVVAGVVTFIVLKKKKQQ